MNNIVELYGHSTENIRLNWIDIVDQQQCVFLNRKCYKVRKSNPNISIGTCTVLSGKLNEPIIICPTRLTQRRQIFIDCLHLLTLHEPGNELHLIPEISIPGGNVDYFLVSMKDKVVHDFVGIELQTLDTTGTVWPTRQLLLKSLGLAVDFGESDLLKPYGINWKMTAKTIMMQMHHKVQTFEYINKKLVLVIQDRFLNYMQGEFNFSHIHPTVNISDSTHIHAYQLEKDLDNELKLKLSTRLSTDANGIARSLGLQADARMELDYITRLIAQRTSNQTILNIL